MTYPIARLNLCGVLLLSALCVVQWREQGRLAHRIAALETERSLLGQGKKEAEKALEGVKTDVEEFRTQIKEAHSDRETADKRHAVAVSEVLALKAELEQLNATVGEWKAAVAARDSMIQGMRQLLDETVRERNAMIEKFNAVGRSQNDAVQRLNSALEELARLRTQATSQSMAKPSAPPSPR